MERLQQFGRHLCPRTEFKKPIKVTVTGAAGNIGYALVFMIGQGRMFGPTQPVELTLLELPSALSVLNGVIMELNDCAYPLLTKITGTSEYREAFTGCQVAVLVGAKPRGPGMERKDLLGQNGLIFKGQGEAINKWADRNIKVLVVGNPANTNAMICQNYAPDIPPQNFTALTRLDQNRALYQIANRVSTDVRNVRNVIIWGNHSVTQVPDAQQGTVERFPAAGVSTSIVGAVSDDKWLQGDFVPTVAKRGAAIIEARKLSSAASAASAACDHIHDWIIGTLPGQYVSMGVISDGSYGIPRGICFSYPVECQNGTWKIVQNLKWNNFAKEKINASTKELMEEKLLALEYIQSQKK